MICTDSALSVPEAAMRRREGGLGRVVLRVVNSSKRVFGY